MPVQTLLILATLLPLVSFIVLVFLGKRMGSPLAGWVATAFIAGSAVCSLWALLTWMHVSGLPADEAVAGIRRPILTAIPWLPVGNGLAQHTQNFLDLGIYIDSLTVAMFAMVTTVSTLIFIFSLGYMADDKRFARFFTYLSLFDFSMLGLVIGGTLLQLFVFWELVGLCSYLLIGFWYEKKSASNAAIKAFVTNRVGDFGFLIGLGILFYHLGNVTLPDVWRLMDVSKMTTQGLQLPSGVWIAPTLLTIMGIGLFFGAVGKSAQFPLHVWLPDAMEGPTPVSALIHAATMVAAGVYLVARIFPVLTPDARLFIAIIGATTLTMAALIAVVQSDIKKVLAYSTLSQLGYMILALGIGSWVGGLFHLITHAFFKALLFLGSGSVIYAAHHEQDMRQYGGLWRKIPVTAITFGIAVFTIAGTPLLSGYYSKEMILEHAGAFAWLSTRDGGHSGFYWLLFILPTGIAYVTAFYMTRCWMLTFWGKPRNQHVYDHAHERPVMYVPLILLAGMSIIAGYGMNVKEFLVNAPREATQLCRQVDATFGGFSRMWPAESEHAGPRGDEEAAVEPESGHPSQVASAMESGGKLIHRYAAWGWIVGITVGALVYLRGYAVANVLMKVAPLRWIHGWLYRRMYFDELYHVMAIGAVMMVSRISGWFDRNVVDGLVNLVGWVGRQLSTVAGLNDRWVVDGAVTGVADLTQDLGAAARAPQTGRIRLYVTLLFGSLATGVVAAVAIALLIASRG